MNDDYIRYSMFVRIECSHCHRFLLRVIFSFLFVVCKIALVMFKSEVVVIILLLDDLLLQTIINQKTERFNVI